MSLELEETVKVSYKKLDWLSGAIEPLHDKVAVLPCPAVEKTKGGLVLPQTAKMRIDKGFVIRSGPDVPEGALLSGETVLYDKLGGIDFKVGGDVVKIFSYNDLLARLPREEAAFSEKDKE